MLLLSRFSDMTPNFKRQQYKSVLCTIKENIAVHLLHLGI